MLLPQESVEQTRPAPQQTPPQSAPEGQDAQIPFTQVVGGVQHVSPQHVVPCGQQSPPLATPLPVAFGQHTSVGPQQTWLPQHTDSPSWPTPLLKQQWTLPAQQWVLGPLQHLPSAHWPMVGPQVAASARPARSPPNAAAAAAARTNFNTARRDGAPSIAVVS
jgi:hypothetical protein